MYEEAFKEETKDIQYVNVNLPVFQMPYYDIKSGNFCVRTGK